MNSLLHSFRRDPRHFQILFLSSFLVYGMWALQWNGDLWKFAITIGTCLLVQAVFIRVLDLDLRSLKSAMITGLGLSLLLHSGQHITMLLAAVVAISSKFLIQSDGKHIFNPGMLGIVVAVCTTNDAWISPGQWGAGPAQAFFLCAAGMMTLFRCGRVDTSMAFLIAYAGLDLVRTVLVYGWGMDVWVHRMTNGSLLLFAFFMITDPVTTPNAPRARVIWAVTIAMIAFILGSWAFVHTAPIWALFAMSLATPLLDKFFHGERFQWIHATGNIPVMTQRDRSVSNQHKQQTRS